MNYQDVNTKRGDASDGGAILGTGVARHDGAAKVRGDAVYAIEHSLPGLLYCVMVNSTIGAGRVVQVDAQKAEAMPGVRMVLHAGNSLELVPQADFFGNRPAGDSYNPFAREIAFNGQLVAAVVAETLEQARAAARAVTVAVENGKVVSTFHDPAAGEGNVIAAMSKDWGDPDAALADAPVVVEATYETPREYNVPIEPHGLIAHWEDDDHLTLYEHSQWIDGMAKYHADAFAIPFDNVRMVCPYIGGGFGSKAQVQPHALAAAIASKLLKQPVKLAVTRPQTFTAFGGRPATRQTLKLGATKDGKLLAIDHDGVNETATYANFTETTGIVTGMMYDVPNFRSRQRTVPVNTVLPGPFRAPGKNPSGFALETAMDELAIKLSMDPVELRLRNEPEKDPETGKPWSTRKLREAYAAGAEAFGWDKRNPEIGSMRDGHELIGWGMAVGTHPVYSGGGEATVSVKADGTVEVSSSAIDMGQGTYTILAQTAADALGVPVERVAVKLGDSRYAGAPVAGGSKLANLMVGAVHKTAMAVRDELVQLGLSDPNSPLRDKANNLMLSGGRIATPAGEGITLAELLAATGRDAVELTRDTLPEAERTPQERRQMFATFASGHKESDFAVSRHSFCAHFIEVRVDEDFGTVRVSRVVTAVDAGRLYNTKLADSQFKGGIIMGIGMALLEEGVTDPRNGRILSANLADYRIATNADVPEIQTISVGVPDFQATPLGGKAVGELAIVGVAAAISNAVYHATGKRVRSLPISIEDLL
ncbi:xanthine dehydrogenase family protein molybdopterin-binding subunit [Rhizobium halophytocola]|uniref:Xanthine dehydrogenase YagR molybdenum-binding subunit n=1 Tax=Rhizobium halophytocola TaxID=735519 RepID=A0ABS4DZR6_9HYPH|nr:xanthine dehydrogenase family protein molybdopterin-binding subunit [Rhizobium halophytocola]MBP1851180.1 xanthine dehydrogenase YagR molybdenum-binding subunit [Rhizobium halophytocola]